MKNIIGLVIVALTLQGCFFLAGGALGATATSIVYDKRSLDTMKEDNTIAFQIRQHLFEYDAPTKKSSLSVTAFNGVVLLTGETETDAEKLYADRAAQQTANVRRVYNEIIVAPNMSLLSKTNDSWITTKVKTNMLADKELRSGQIKVVTDHAVVYLLGNVTRRQGDLAAEIAREVVGVQRVVKLFDYQTE